MANYKRLVTELRDEGASVRPADIARALGISKVYAWQLENGKRESIDSKAARAIEREMHKPVGWLDTDFELWPFPDADLLGRIEALDYARRLELQGVLRKVLADFEQATPRGIPKDELHAQTLHEPAPAYAEPQGSIARNGLAVVKPGARRVPQTSALDRENARHRGVESNERQTDGASSEPKKDIGNS